MLMVNGEMAGAASAKVGDVLLTPNGPEEITALEDVTESGAYHIYCVRHKVICVPGIFFDVNPFHRRRFHKSPYIDKLRMSYGPAWPNLKQAVKGMKEIIELAKAGRLPPLGEPTTD